MPARVMAMNAANPDRISTTSNAHEAAGMAPPRAIPDGLSAAVSSANLAMNPDSGGSPAMTSAQPMKADPEHAHRGRNGHADLVLFVDASSSSP